MAGLNRQIISVSQLNRDVRGLLESEFPILYVEGEISNFARPSSGHWYFTLKDDKAQIRCAMFRNRNHLVKFQPRNGQQVIVRGRISLYEGRGEFQMIAEFLEDSGDGALRLAFDKLRNSLQAEGLFDESRKKPVPEVPNHIAIITSPSGAAIQDVLTVMKRRFPAVHISILPVQVQGEGSVPQIVKALEFANHYEADPFDLILLTRGGGSLEDLWSFNTEPVARAVAASHLPVVCAVGHESDVSIADFVADLRAATPSAAAELMTPDGEVWADRFESLQHRLVQSLAQQMADHRREIDHLTRRLRHPAQHLSNLSQRLDDLERRLISHGSRLIEDQNLTAIYRRMQLAIRATLAASRSRLESVKLASPTARLNISQGQLSNLTDRLVTVEAASRREQSARLGNIAAKLDALSPLATLQRGFSIVADAEGHILTSTDAIEPGDQIRARLSKGSLVAQVMSKEE